MEYTYKTQNTCSKTIKFKLNKNIVSDVKFEGGIKCGTKGTSCADQLAKAVRQAYNNSKNS